VAILQELDDELLLKHIQDGSHQAYRILVERHARRFYRVAFRFLTDRDEAEDVVQECFIKLWEQPDMWNSGKHARFTTWFYRVVVNKSLDYQKKKPTLGLEDDDSIEDEFIKQDEALILTEEQHAVEKEIQALPERQRTALTLCFYEELSNKEAADVMGVNLKALQSLLMRAKTTLKERLKAYM
jgi:RNA polymerase sigma-70 factor (ECF subfamily)